MVKYLITYKAFYKDKDCEYLGNIYLERKTEIAEFEDVKTILQEINDNNQYRCVVILNIMKLGE